MATDVVTSTTNAAAGRGTLSSASAATTAASSLTLRPLQHLAEDVANRDGDEDRLKRPLLDEAPQVGRPRVDVSPGEALDLRARVIDEISGDILCATRQTAHACLRVRPRALGRITCVLHQSASLLRCLIEPFVRAVLHDGTPPFHL